MKVLKDPFVIQLINFFSLRAFRPDPFDMTAPLQTRFLRRKIIAFAVYPTVLKSAEIYFAGSNPRIKLLASAPRAQGDDHELLGLVKEAAEMAPQAKHSLVLYNYGFNALKSFNIKRTETLWMQLKSSPSAVLGDDFEPNHQYSLVHHPVRDNSIVFAYEHNAINHLEKLFESAGLPAVRIQHTIGSLFTNLCQQYNGEIPAPVVIISGSSVFFLDVDPANDFEWMLLRNRSENPVRSAVEEKRQMNFLNQILPPKGTILLVTDEIDASHSWEDKIREKHPELKIMRPDKFTGDPQSFVFHAGSQN